MANALGLTTLGVIAARLEVRGPCALGDGKRPRASRGPPPFADWRPRWAKAGVTPWFGPTH